MEKDIKETMKMRPKTAKAFRNILDTFSGSDGGGRFMFTRVLVETMDKQASGGDVAAQGVVDIVIRMSRLIDKADEIMTKGNIK